MMPVVYIAGPFSAPTAWGIEQNVRRAEEAGLAVAEMGASPLIPHANTRYFVGTKSSAFWYDATLALLLKCDAIFMLPTWTSSKGAAAEVAAADKAGMPMFVELPFLKVWVERWLKAVSK